MDRSTTDAFWERLAARTTPAGSLADIESPRVVGWLVVGALGGATLFTLALTIVFFVAGEALAVWATAVLALCYVATWVWHAATGMVTGPTVLAVVVSIANQIALHVALGGYAYSGGYLMWGIAMTFVLALMRGRRAALATAAFYLVVAVVFAFLEDTLAASRPPPPQGLSTTLFSLVLIGNLVMVASILVFFLTRISFERERAEDLLLNVLPEEVAAELKEKGRVPARRFESISVLFADIVGFTVLNTQVPPEEMVERLNAIFTEFDRLADLYDCEKIRTIGDAYMVAAGVPVPRDDHAQALASMALDMLAFADEGPLKFRIGINSGPVVAGVIGTRKFQYDVWGDTVNTASRMESHGRPDCIQITEATYRLIESEFVCVPRGPIDVKGKGTLETWFVEGRRAPETV